MACLFMSFAVKKKVPSNNTHLPIVFQIWRQFPCSFEFSEDFLIMLCQHSYSSQFGTFMGNTDQERKHYELTKKTTSLWLVTLCLMGIGKPLPYAFYGNR